MDPKRDDVVVGGLIVTYNPVIPLLERALNSVRDQVSSLLVVENGSSNSSEIQGVCDRTGARLISNPRNMGLAAALNVGAAEFKATLGADWVLIVDQDTVLPVDYVSRLLTLLESGGFDEPRVWVVRGSERPVTATRPRSHPRDFRYIRGAVMSGSLVRMEGLKQTRFREDFFVDLVDSDFYYQVAERGYKTVRFEGVEFPHTVGTVIDLQGRATSYENSRRTYHIARNGIRLVLEGRWDYKLPWVIVSSAFPVMYVEGIRVAISSLARGLFDGFANRINPQSSRGSG